MPTAIETRIFKLRHDPDASKRIGYLVSQQRLAYNYAVNILNPNTRHRAAQVPTPS